MRNILVPIAITTLIIAVPCVSAESYSISGTATYSNAVPVEMGKIQVECCLLYTSPSPRDQRGSRMPSSA